MADNLERFRLMLPDADGGYKWVDAVEPRAFDWMGMKFFTHLHPEDPEKGYGATEATTGASVTKSLGWFPTPRDAELRAYDRLGQVGVSGVKKSIAKAKKWARGAALKESK